MKCFSVFVNGTNILTIKDDKMQKIGFHTTVYVEANSKEEAKNKAISILNEDNELLELIKNEKSDNPVMLAKEIKEIESLKGLNLPRAVFSFYDESDKYKDYRNEFKKIYPKIRKQWIIIILLFFGTIPFTLIFGLPFNFIGFEDAILIGFILYSIVYMYAIIKLYIIGKCPNCNKSLYTLFEIKSIPILTKSWISKYCTHCGVQLK